MRDPIAQFSTWFDEAKACKAIADASAMSLATVGADGQPSLRMVLLKGYDERGFVFYTNMESRKSKELAVNPKAALCFHWAPIHKQLRIEGVAERVDDAEADAYFATRPRESQLGAWASNQSESLASHDALLQSFKQVETQYAGKDIPRPPHWSGWRIAPQKIEFWQQGDFRLHKRILYTHACGAWARTILNP